MSDPEQLKTLACQRVDQLFEGRRKRAGLFTENPEWYSQCEAEEPQQFPGGWQARVRTWIHWSDAKVDFHSDNGDVLYWCVDRLSDPPSDKEMNKADALKLAESLITIPSDAELAGFSHELFAKDRKLARLEWRHIHQDMRVEGDYLWILIHPEANRIVAFAKKWRTISL